MSKLESVQKSVIINHMSINKLNTLIYLTISDFRSGKSGAKTIKNNTYSTQNKSQTHRAKQYEVTSFLSTDCELSTETCSKNVYSLGPST